MAGYYTIVFAKAAAKDVARLSPPIKKRIRQKLEYFMEQPDPLKLAKPLVNSKAGQYRWRVGDYRVSFDVDGHAIVVLRVRHRSDIYR